MITLEKIEQSNQEQKEKEQLPILFIYRDNDLFREHMPEIVNNLQAWGRKAEAQVFPQGTKKEEIREWIEANQAELIKKELITDDTVGSQFRREMIRDAVTNCYEYRLQKELREKGTKFVADLDQLFEDATRRAALGNELNDTISDMEKYNRERLSATEEYEKVIFVAGKGVERIIKQYLKKGGDLPRQVYVFTNKIYDHEPFSYVRGIEAKKAGIDYSDFSLTEEHFEKAGELVKEWLVKAGIPKEIIRIEGNITREITRMSGIGTWFIFDRHNIKKRFDDDDKSYMTYEHQSIHTSKIHNLRAFVLPFSDFYRTAREQGVLNVDQQEFCDALNKTFEKVFIEQPKKSKK